jgi:NAD(P)-dependent dehydrogenase (short-subunit alcohol dehydrogenase family)
MANETLVKNPKHDGPKPPYPEQRQSMPGHEGRMDPKPDHGEESYKGFGRLKDRVALITGGDSGIGRAVAIAYAREGADVIVSYLPQEEEDANETCRWVEQAGRKSLKLPGDISDIKHCEQMIERIFRDFGRLDILINNAAFQSVHEKADEWSPEEIEHTFKTNILAMFWLVRAALPRMKEGSVIINTASIQAYNPSPHLLAYAATKGAIVNFTKGLSKLAMQQGIRVNAVAPGPVWTPLIPSTFDPEKTKNFGKDTSFERPAQPAELAPIYVFLSTNESSYVTGEVFAATGGKTPF